MSKEINYKFTRVNQIKDILVKTVFLCAPKLSLPIYTTYIQHTYLIFGPHLDPPQNIQIINFTFLYSFFTPFWDQNKVLSSI